jgi:hypothetical protein
MFYYAASTNVSHIYFGELCKGGVPHKSDVATAIVILDAVAIVT